MCYNNIILLFIPNQTVDACALEFALLATPKCARSVQIVSTKWVSKFIIK